jgi:lipopolysaccharide transport system permease protein
MQHLKAQLRLAWDIALRDFRLTYSRSLFGRAWVVVSPLALIAIYWLVFGVALDVRWTLPSAGATGFLLPFLCALVHFVLLAEVMGSATNVFIVKRTFVQKSSLPLWILPFSAWLRAVLAGLVPLGLLLVLAAVTVAPAATGYLWAVGAAMLAALVALGACLLLAAVGAYVGDLAPMMQLFVRVLFYAAPVTYPLAMVPDAVRGWLWLNPITALAEVTRAALVYDTAPPPHAVAIAVAMAIAAIASGAFVHSRVRRYIPDVV